MATSRPSLKRYAAPFTLLAILLPICGKPSSKRKVTGKGEQGLYYGLWEYEIFGWKTKGIRDFQKEIWILEHKNAIFENVFYKYITGNDVIGSNWQIKL